MESIKVVVEGHVLDEVATALKGLLHEQDIDVQIKPASARFDGLALEPTSLIVVGASVLSALITALLAYLANRQSGTITIKGTSGWLIKIPKDTPKEEIEGYIRFAREDIDHIRLDYPEKKIGTPVDGQR